jgi:hypothetical protein
MIRLAILATLLATACQWEPASDGPIMAYELHGTWCNQDSERVCLTVSLPQDTGLPTSRYVWAVGTCIETGKLTGGLEFQPDTNSRLCLAPEYDLYSAGAEWTGSGLKLELDASTGEHHTITLELDYVPNR